MQQINPLKRQAEIIHIMLIQCLLANFEKRRERLVAANMLNHEVLTQYQIYPLIFMHLPFFSTFLGFIFLV